MNPDNRVGGGSECMSAAPPPSCAACCGVCPPQQQPVNTCAAINTKLEPANLPQYICVPKMCSIFGGHDTNYYPENHDTCPSPRSRHHRNQNLNTLGSPVGLVKSSFVIKSAEVKSSELHPQRFATYLKAFAKIYLTPEDGWSSNEIDRLLKEGQELYAESNQFKMQDEENPETSEIYSNTEAKIIRSFEVDGSAFQVELNKKFQLIPLESSGDAPIPDLQIDILRSALKAFFRQARYGLLKVTNWYLMIWKSRGVYFVFDFYGRRVNDFVTDREKGVAMLICLKSLDNVHHLIANLSGLHKGDPFNVREMKVVKLTGPDGKTMNREYGKRVNQYEVISADYAFLKSALHLTLNKADPLRNRSALPVAVAALLASKIDHPATWNQKVVDKIICYGVNICRLCWEQCLNAKEPIELDKFPNQLKLGQFLAHYALTPRRFEGTWKCVPNYKQSALAVALEKSFELQDNYLLVQVGLQIYAVWKKNNFIYLFDPYRHRIDKQGLTEGTESKSATVRMFRSFEIFLNVFTQLLLESNRSTKFYIHRLKILSIRLADKSEGGTASGTCAAELTPVAEEIVEQVDDVLSLNETICFEEDETKCMEELGEISDFEDDDITSSVMQMDIKEPKSETDESEEGMEEEEGGLEDLGEYESSSSGGGGRHGRHRKKKGDKKGGKDKGGKSKKDKADKKGKGKKGKGAKDDDGGKKRKKKSKSDDDDDDSSKKKKKKGDRDSEDEDGKKKKGDRDSSASGGKKKSTDDAATKRGSKDGDGDAKDSSLDADGKRKAGGDRDSSADGRGDRDGRGGRGGSASDRGGTDGDEDTDGYGQGRVGNCNKYPGYTSVPHDMAVVGSESGTYESICRLLRAGFKCADRMLLMTPWGNYVIFRAFNMFKKQYYLFDGCTCNINRFRHLDLNCGTAGLLCFHNLHDVICYIIDSQEIRTCIQRSRKDVVDEICRQYCRQ